MKKIVSLILSAVILVSVCVCGVSARMTNGDWTKITDELRLLTVFSDDMTLSYVIYRMQTHLIDRSDTEYWMDMKPKTLPATEVEDVLYRLFDRDYCASIGLLDSLREAFDYDGTASTYVIPPLGGFGGFMYDYLPRGFVSLGDDKYDIYYQHVTYEYCPELTDELAEQIGFNDDWTVTYNGFDWTNYFGDYGRIGSYESYGVKVTVKLSGDDVMICGCEKFDSVPELESVPETVPGDSNGDGSVSAKDVSALMKSLAGFGSVPDEAAADANGDGVINAKDVAQIMKYLAGWDVVLGA